MSRQATADKTTKADQQPERSDSQAENQGEGDVEAARRYNKRAESFVDSDQGQRQIDDHPVKSTVEGHENQAAEEAARKRAKEHDPEEARDYNQPA